MAVTNLAVQTTLGQLKANIRSQTGTLSPQESQLLELQLNAVVHNAILFVRSVYGRLLDDFYSTTVAPTETSNLIDISGYAIQDINTMTLSDVGYSGASGVSGYSGVIPFVENNVFIQKQMLFSPSDLAYTVLATISNIGESSGKLQIKTFRGTSATPASTLSLSYTRIPFKTTTDSGKVDIPDAYIPAVQDVATVYVLQKFGKPIDPDTRTRLQSALGSAVSQIGVTIPPEVK